MVSCVDTFSTRSVLTHRQRDLIKCAMPPIFYNFFLNKAESLELPLEEITSDIVKVLNFFIGIEVERKTRAYFSKRIVNHPSAGAMLYNIQRRSRRGEMSTFIDGRKRVQCD